MLRPLFSATVPINSSSSTLVFTDQTGRRRSLPSPASSDPWAAASHASILTRTTSTRGAHTNVHSLCITAAAASRRRRYKVPPAVVLLDLVILCTTDGCHSPTSRSASSARVRPISITYALDLAVCGGRHMQAEFLVTHRALNNGDHARSTFQRDTSNA